MKLTVPSGNVIKLWGCQPELVEGGFITTYRVRHPDSYRDTLTAFINY